MRLVRSFLVPAAFLCASCNLSVQGVCIDDAGSGILITGNFKEGKGYLPSNPPPSINPLPVSALIYSSVLLREVKLGGVNAALKTGSQYEWEARVFPANLELARDGGEAVLLIEVVDTCGTHRTLDDVAIVPLGPKAGAAVTSLELFVTPTIAGECSLPVSGSTQALVRVTGSKESAGGKVRIDANQGTFPGGSATTEVTLVSSGSGAEQSVWFLPNHEGSGVIAASAVGAPTKSEPILVVAAPSVSAPTRLARREFDYFVYANTAGNLDKCSVELSSAGVAVVTLDSRDGGVVGSLTDVRESPMSCVTREELRLKVRFGADAPDGGAVTVRCADTHSQSGSVTLSVDAPDMPPAQKVSGLGLEAVIAPAGECSIPLNASAPLLVRAFASAGSVGATVKVDANQGTFSGGAASTNLVLGPVMTTDGGIRAEQTTYFFPTKEGPAVLSASAPAAASVAVVVPVTGPPQFSAPTRALPPGVDGYGSVTSPGNLKTCAAEESFAGSSVVEIVEPPLGVINQTLSVAQATSSCSAPELVRFRVSFDAGSPDGGAVTVRCRDSFGQEASAVFTLAR